jgi:amidase
MIYDIKEDMAAYLAHAPAAVKVRTMADLIAFNRNDPRENVHRQDFFEAAEATSGSRGNPEYTETLRYAQVRAGRDGYDRGLSKYHVSAFVGITRGPAEIIPPDGQQGGHVAGKRRKGEVPPSISGVAALAGYPNLSVPMGQVDGLPVGLSFVGPAWSEQLLLSLGYAYELASHARVPPTAYQRYYDVEEVSLAQLSADLASGRITSVGATSAYIERIKRYDDLLNAVIGIAPDALQQAAAADQRRRDGKLLGPLDGLPILLKDNLDAVGMPTTAGSYALAENFPTRDSEVVRRLRAAGAVILGKANTSQFAGFRTTKGLNGSTVGGSTRNPYDLTRSAAGSSNGPGIATAVSFAAATIGTETSGSITGPSNVNGVVGIKPTIALVSRRGIVPISLTQDSAGPMTRTVADAAMLLTVIAGSDPADRWSQDADAHKTDYLRGLSVEALKGKRIGVLRGLRGQDEKTTPVLDEALRVLEARGAQLVDIPTPGLLDIRPEMRSILIQDFKEDLNAYLAGTPASVKVRTLADLIAFNRTDARESMHGQDIFEDSEATHDGRADPEYRKTLAKALRMTREEGLDRLFKHFKVVALVTLTGGPADTIPPDGSSEGHPVSAQPRGSQPSSVTPYAAIAGYPHLSVPMGQVDGMPVGMSFVGPAWSEQLLLSLGYAYEQAARKRVPPTAYKHSLAVR